MMGSVRSTYREFQRKVTYQSCESISLILHKESGFEGYFYEIVNFLCLSQAKYSTNMPVLLNYSFSTCFLCF